MPIALLTGPVDWVTLRATLNGLILDINAAGTTSGSIPLMEGPAMPGSVAATLNGLFLQINDVTAPGTVPLLSGPVELADARALLNNAIIAFNAFGGGSSYTAKAVHFDGEAWLAIASSIAADSPLLTFSLWAKTAALPDMVNWYFFDFDPSNRESGLDINLDVDNPGIVTQTWSIAAHSLNSTSAKNVWTTGVWHHVFGYLDTDQDAGNKVIKLFIDAVDVTGSVGDAAAAFTLNFGSAGWAIPDSTDDLPTPFFTGDMADVFIAPGVMEPDITIFRNAGTGKPENPSGFPSGAILFSGDHTTFPTNQGSGGAFTLTGSLTSASTSPSD